MKSKVIKCLVLALAAGLSAEGANPFLPLWEYIPDGEPHVFEDPAAPGRMRVYLYGSHDTRRNGYCGFDLVAWSAPVNDLGDWRFDGVIFRSEKGADGKPLNPDGSGDRIYAPDVVCVKDADGRKTYYLYPNIVSRMRGNLVAKSDSPTGPFVACNWSKDDPKKTVGCMGFDPAVLVDDDGRIYGYWGGNRSFAAELDPMTMATVKPGTKVVPDLVGGRRQKGVFKFYEASSIRKVKGKYVFIYSRWTKDGEFGLKDSNYTLAYAYSDKPLGPYTYGGTIIDGRGRERREDGTTIVTAHPNGNTHGSICEIGGRWYVFYHRQCGLDQFSRQAMVAPITVEVDERPGGKVVISEAEYTSEGFETEGLDPFARHSAGIACCYTGPQRATAGTKEHFHRYYFTGPYPEPFRAKDGYAAKDPFDPGVSRCCIVNCTDGSTVGYKYFNFDRTFGVDGLRLVVKLAPEGVPGKMTVWAVAPSESRGGVKVGELDFASLRGNEEREVEIAVDALAKVKGRKALYLAFASESKSQSLCSLVDFRFAPAKPDGSL